MSKIDKTQIIVAIISGLFGLMTSITPVIITSIINSKPLSQPAYSAPVAELAPIKAPMLEQTQSEQRAEDFSPAPKLLNEEAQSSDNQGLLSVTENFLNYVANNIVFVGFVTLISALLGLFVLTRIRSSREKERHIRYKD